MYENANSHSICLWRVHADDGEHLGSRLRCVTQILRETFFGGRNEKDLQSNQYPYPATTRKITMTTLQQANAKVITEISSILKDFLENLTTANFSEKKSSIETAFSTVHKLGIDVKDLKVEYFTELIQCGGNPSYGRLFYIKGHLQTLLDKVESYS